MNTLTNAALEHCRKVDSEYRQLAQALGLAVMPFLGTVRPELATAGKTFAVEDFRVQDRNLFVNCNLGGYKFSLLFSESETQDILSNLVQL